MDSLPDIRYLRRSYADRSAHLCNMHMKCLFQGCTSMRGDRKCAARWSAFNPIQVKQTPGESRAKRTGNVVFTLAPINMPRNKKQPMLFEWLAGNPKLF